MTGMWRSHTALKYRSTTARIGVLVLGMISLAGCGSSLALVGAASAITTPPSPLPSVSSTKKVFKETIVNIPNVPAAVNQGSEYVQLPSDAPVVSEATAEATATSWAQTYAGTTKFNSVLLAHIQNIYPNGGLDGPVGSLQWFFTIIGPKSFTGHMAPPPFPTAIPSARPYTYPAHYVIIAVNAITGQEDGMTLT